MIVPEDQGSVMAAVMTHAEARPGAECMRLLRPDGDWVISYGELVDEARACARVLSSRGIEKGDVVPIVLEPGRVLVATFFGAMILGAVPTIFSLPSDKVGFAKYVERLIGVCRTSGAKFLVLDGELQKALMCAWDEVGLDTEMLAMEDLVPMVHQVVLPDLSTQKVDLALLQHSSGSTGAQKGVALSHRAILNQIGSYAAALELRTDDKIVSWLPLYHDMGLIACFILPLICGVPVVQMSPFDWIKDPALMLEAVHRFKATLCWVPNFALNFCANKISDARLVGIDLSSLRALINCSEPMSAASHELFAQRFAQYGFRASALATCYALAENTFAATQGGVVEPVRIDEIDRSVLEADNEAVAASGAARSNVSLLSVGRPIAGIEMKVVGTDGRDLPDRQVGEIAIRSHCMLSEYFKRPDLTAKALRDGWYHTGDLGYREDGYWYITGRKSDLIIVGGKNIYAQDLEAAASETSGVHPGRTVAVGLYNENAGTDEVALVAEVEDELDLQSREIKKDIRKNVAAAADCIVNRVFLVPSDWLIKTSSGKIARLDNQKKLMSELAQGK
jgi:fatty-acyl-CoA synthase